MKKIKLLLIIFSITLTIPLAYLVLQTFQGLKQEETAKLRFFANTLFDAMEGKLADLISLEENRSVDQYNFTYLPLPGQSRSQTSPLAIMPKDDSYILGYLQNNPDGSLQTPLVKDLDKVPLAKQDLVKQLKDINRIFNRKRITDAKRLTASKPETETGLNSKIIKSRSKGFASQYLDMSQSRSKKSKLGYQESRIKEISAGQVLNVIKKEGQRGAAPIAANPDEVLSGKTMLMSQENEESAYIQPLAEKEPRLRQYFQKDKFQVEVAPLQSVFINDGQIFIFRRVIINNQIFRQGFILKVKPFLNHLAATCFVNQPMANFTNLSLKVIDRGRRTEVIRSGIMVDQPLFSLNRRFPPPFDFLFTTLTCRQIPAAQSRTTLKIVLAVLGIVLFMGFFAIYQSVWAVVALSERRANFVSSVTHELKTPLTNIRMYIEMLEMGVARDIAQERKYFKILGSESERLSHLINNVLELSRLEQKQRHFAMEPGSLKQEVAKAITIMQARLDKAGFTLKMKIEKIPPFYYDREVMLQILINLIENSIKFGAKSITKDIKLKVSRQADNIHLSIADKGPGIAPKSLKKIFNEFYREDNNLTRTTGGTGIGLALVKKFTTAMHGSITASNNKESGCTILLVFPVDEAA